MAGTSEEICDPKRCSIGEALRIARERARENLWYDLQIIQFVSDQWDARHIDMGALERGLEILGAISPPRRLFGVLRTAMSQDDPELRSKAALALAKHVENTSVLEKLATDGDARVRANTIEALWHRHTPAAEAVLLRALDDTHHRVAINAAYGLYLMNPGKYIGQVEAFVGHPQPGHRIAAAWLIRKIGDPGLLRLLKTLVRDDDPEVRRTSFRTLAMLRSSTAASP
ncbi:MAG: HEAT repeat domain-containing protein [Acidobacteriota bacterium]